MGFTKSFILVRSLVRPAAMKNSVLGKRPQKRKEEKKKKLTTFENNQPTYQPIENLFNYV